MTANTSSLGIVACQSLYADLAILAPDAAVRFVPPELAEFPVNVPVETAIVDAVQREIDALDRSDIDRILTLYPNGNGELTGVRTTHTPLFVSQIDDAISMFIHDVEPWTMGEPKRFGTYYLSRGWIDGGVDAYKLYTSYVGNHEELRSLFECGADHDDLRVLWDEGDRFRAALDRDIVPSCRLADRFFAEIMRYYDHVTLVETPAPLYDLHYDYAGRFQSFIAKLKREHSECHSREHATGQATLGTRDDVVENEGKNDDTDSLVSLSTLAGDDSLIRSFLACEDPAETPEYLRAYPPGTPVR